MSINKNSSDYILLKQLYQNDGLKTHFFVIETLIPKKPGNFLRPNKCSCLFQAMQVKREKTLVDNEGRSMVWLNNDRTSQREKSGPCKILLSLPTPRPT